jgi:small subunit ribosomal protein S4
MIRKKKLFVKPRKAYEKTRILEENVLMEKYALKNKREIWKALAKVNYFRSRAKALASASSEEQNILFGKLNAIGIKVNSTADVLALKVENLLERRLPSVIHKKGLALTTRQARQLVAHKKILVSGKVVNAPSYLVNVSEESSISLKGKEKKSKPAPQESENKQ